MEQEAIKITDIMRIIQGEVPWSFLIEVVIRIFFIYLILMFSMKLMGKRMASTLTRNELAALVSLAAAVGVPLQVPDKGLLPALIICMIVVIIQRLMAIWMFRNNKLERLTQGDIDILVQNGVLNLETMKKALLSRERVFAQLRSESIDNLGRVKRLYMENSGSFNILTFNEPRQGLSLIPEWDEEYRKTRNIATNAFSCNNCGFVVHTPTAPEQACQRCQEKDWERAVES